jgi:hypothetical protein
MSKAAFQCLLTTLAVLSIATSPAVAQEVSIQVKPDNSVLVTQGFELEQVVADDATVSDAQETSRMTVLFPEQKPAVYELESEEDYVLVVDGWLPEGADILLEAHDTNTGEEVESFEHIIRGGDWLIDAKYLNELPTGEVTISATLRTPDRRDAVVSHPFYILEADALAEDDNQKWFDWEVGDLDNAAPFVPGEGFMTFTPPADARVYYVAESGSDSNSGLSESRPLRTLRAGYDKLRDGSGDWLLLKAGDVFEGGFGTWGKSGQSMEKPLHVGVYGDGDRPLVRTNGGGFWRGYTGVYNVRFDGIHAFANRRLPDVTEWKEGGMVMIGKGGNILVHDCKIEGFKVNLVFQGFGGGVIRNVAFYRTIVNNAYGHWDHAIGGHSQGIYAESVDALQFIECTFDRNGWNPGISGAVRTKFNHNIYIQDNCSDVTVRRNIITRGSSHGLQLRPGGDVVDNLFVRNALGFFVADNESIAIDNVVMECDDISDREIRGQGIEILPTVQVTLANNIVTRKVGRAGWMPGIDVKWTKRLAELSGYNVQMHDNVIWDWWTDKPHKPLKVDKAANMSRYNNAVDGVVSETGARVRYYDPTRDLASYVDGGLSEFLKNAVNRRRGEWNDTFTAPAFNAYMREGFSPAGSSGSDL